MWSGLDSIDDALLAEGSVVTIGVFDGIHRGHQRLIAEATARAQAAGLPSVCMTFDPHPLSVLRPESMPPLLGTMDMRAKTVEALGIDAMLAVRFTAALASLSPEVFFTRILVTRLHARVIVVGENFTFGYRAAGTVDTLRALGAAYGVEVVIVPLLVDGTTTVSSSAIRAALASGDMESATRFLGRPFAVSGIVVRGAGRGGASLGFPTANLYFPDTQALPVDGVYAGWCEIESGHHGVGSVTTGTMMSGRRYASAVSVGTNPTFGDEQRSVEAFVLHQDADLYGYTCSISFVAHVRAMVKFASIDELLSAMHEDVRECERLLALSEMNQ